MKQQTEDAALRHRQAWDLIPWAVNGRASEEERLAVSQHLTSCSDCREEFEFQSGLAAAMQQDQAGDEGLDAQAGRIWQRLDAQVPPRRLTRLRSLATPVRLLAAAALVEAVGLAALGSGLMGSQHPGAGAAHYQTLSLASAAAPGATVRLVLAPDMPVGEFQNLLAAVQMQVVGGPSEAGVYSLAPLPVSASASPRPGTQLVLKRLRASPAVRFAEPVEARAQIPASPGS
jgi:putative zinc finger protein